MKLSKLRQLLQRAGENSITKDPNVIITIDKPHLVDHERDILQVEIHGIRVVGDQVGELEGQVVIVVE